jgi:hypothetical protein
MAAEKSNEQRYPFNSLAIGESIVITGVEGNIRSAASMWGRRYGVWLSTERIDDGVVKVTRIPVPVSRRDFGRLEVILTSMMDMLQEMKTLLEDMKK